MIKKVINKIREKYYYSKYRLDKLSKEELLAIIRHDCHRIEKSVYNNIFETKRDYFTHKKEKVLLILSILEYKKWYDDENPIILWAHRIINGFNDLQNDFVNVYKTPAREFDISETNLIIEKFKLRRSCRTWDDKKNQPSEEELKQLALKMIDAARWSPNSGNRQAWKFAIITNEEEKHFLKGLKEKHCYTSPLVIFIGMDSRFYSPAYHLKDCLYIDAGAAIMQMVNIANISGIGVCWNHLSDDLIYSRKSNEKAYLKFRQKIGIHDYIKPVAILSVGKAKFIPPLPSRFEVEDYLI